MKRKQPARKAKKPFSNSVVEEKFTISIGGVWVDPEDGAYDATIGGEKRNGKQEDAYLVVGCHRFHTKDRAEVHWKGGVSQDSGKKRPLAAALISLADAEFKKRGYKW